MVADKDLIGTAQRVTLDGYTFFLVGGGIGDDNAALDSAIDAANAPVGAPAAPPAPAPSDAAAGAAPAAPATPAAAAAPDPSREELAAYKALGYSPQQIAQIAQYAQRAHEQEQAAQARQRAEWERSTEGQRVGQRQQAMLGLLEETFGRERLVRMLQAADAMPEFESQANGERIEQSRTTMAKAADEHGLLMEGTAEEKRDLERVVAAHIQEDDKLNAMYFNRETRADAIREAVARQAAYENRRAIKMGASDLKTAAQRRAAVPRTTRGGSLTKVTELKPTSKPGTAAYRHEHRQIGAAALDAVLDGMAW